MVARSLAVFWLHSIWALLAPAIEARVSATPQFETWISDSPFTGCVTSNVSAKLVHFPATRASPRKRFLGSLLTSRCSRFTMGRDINRLYSEVLYDMAGRQKNTKNDKFPVRWSFSVLYLITTIYDQQSTLNTRLDRVRKVTTRNSVKRWLYSKIESSKKNIWQS